MSEKSISDNLQYIADSRHVALAFIGNLSHGRVIDVVLLEFVKVSSLVARRSQ